MGAVYGRLLFATGYAWRGTDWADNVSELAWQKMREHIERAHDVFFEKVPKQEECPIWYRLLHSISIADDSDSEEMQQRYDRALRCDPYEIEVARTRVYQLLPRWHGNYDEIEAFAAEAADRTADQYGQAMYARLYADVAQYEPLQETKIDYDRVVKGYCDWFQQTGSQWAANKVAWTAYVFDDRKTLSGIIPEVMSELHLDCWGSASHVAEAFAMVKGAA